jgi:hypothetical protein
MPRKTTRDERRTVSKDAMTVKSVIGKSFSGNREVWRVTSNGEIRTMVTSVSSTQTIDRAVEDFGPALRRLAYR